MLLAVREIMDAENPLPIRIGVNQGSVFVGEVGPHYRRTFTVMGDAVNLAARLMAKAAPGEILTTPDLLARSRTGFESTELEPFFVKGKAKPVRARASRRQDEGSDQRRRRRAALRRPSARSCSSSRRSRDRRRPVAARWSRSSARPGSESRGWPAGCARSRPTGCSSSPSASATTRRPRTTRCGGSSVVSSELPAEGSDEDLAAPFLAELERTGAGSPPVGTAHRHGDRRCRCPRPARPWSSKRSSGARSWPRPSSALLAVLLPRSGLITIEDVHFMDEASADLFGHLARAVHLTSWLWCLTRRDVGVGLHRARGHPGHPRRARSVEPGGGRRARLGGDAGVPAAESGDPAPRRPFRGQSALRPGAHGGGAAGGLHQRACPTRSRTSSSPASIASPPTDRHLLRRMSVLGQSFSADLLTDVVDDVPEAMTRSGPGSSRSSCRTSSATWRSATRCCATAPTTGSPSVFAASCIPAPATRFGRAAARGGDDQAELLSFHYLHAQRSQEAWSYSLQAAERAKERLRQRRGGGVLRTGDRRGPPTARAGSGGDRRARTRRWGTPGT